MYSLTMIRIVLLAAAIAMLAKTGGYLTADKSGPTIAKPVLTANVVPTEFAVGFPKDSGL